MMAVSLALIFSSDPLADPLLRPRVDVRVGSWSQSIADQAADPALSFDNADTPKVYSNTSRSPWD